MPDQYTKKASEIRPPIAGQICAIATSSTTAFSVDLRLVGPQAASMGNDTILPPSSVNNPPGALERFVEIYADGQDYGILFGATEAAVEGANKPVLATAATPGTPTATPAAAGQCMRIPSGQSRSFVIEADCFWLGAVCASASAGTLRIAVTSR